MLALHTLTLACQINDRRARLVATSHLSPPLFHPLPSPPSALLSPTTTVTNSLSYPSPSHSILSFDRSRARCFPHSPVAVPTAQSFCVARSYANFPLFRGPPSSSLRPSHRRTETLLTLHGRARLSVMNVTEILSNTLSPGRIPRWT